MVNGQHSKRVVTNEITPGLIVFINLVDPVQGIAPCLAEDIKLRAC